MVDLGYWAKPFILEDSYLDDHKMITYSVPLKYDGEIYGVLGVEISLDFLNSYYSTNDLISFIRIIRLIDRQCISCIS